MKTLGSETVWVVHGSDGLDEMTTTGETYVSALENGMVRSFTITPEEFGLKRSAHDALKGGEAAYNAQALRDVVEGKRTAYRDIAVMNAAAGLIVAGRADKPKQAAELAEAAIDDGRVRKTLEALIAASTEA